MSTNNCIALNNKVYMYLFILRINEFNKRINDDSQRVEIAKI